ncbi:glutamate synthase-related protein [Desulfurobacterium indicum]|uniref:glutamate synthase (NADPH) n=1 Tax=Desulfurobacterium indicum TaxID=1914305 RepID=A0A1R1MKU2_9BACT|nr:glutamate synthase-related protein [Desulfurobacterium indicum]OMH40427.1 FMN-binding glutamate synthase family protein [Desulfurobacterium indicum]
MLFKKPQVAFYPFMVLRDPDRCVKCKSCVDQCTFDATYYDEDYDRILNRNENCVNCKRCEAFCPTDAIKVVPNPSTFHPDANWTPEAIRDIHVQMLTGAVILTSTGNDKPYRNYFDHLLLDACQVTNPSIDPLREPMELKTFLGRKPDKLEFEEDEISIKTTIGKQLKLEIPVLFSAMSYGSINLNLQKAMAMAAEENGTYWNTGEGGLHRSLRKYKNCTIVQVASGRFGVDINYLETSAAIEIKIGQGAKPGIGGHLPGEKVNEGIAETRMIPVGADAISPAPHHDIYSIEDLRQLIYALKEATNYEKPVSVKIAAVHNVAAIATGIAHAGADIIAIDGFRGGTGATPKSLRDYVGIPIELAIAAVDDRLRKEGLRNNVSLIAAGGFRNPIDVLKAIALGADAVYIGTVALLAAGCTQCQQCHTGRCAWGITTNDPKLAKRLNPDIVAENLSNLLRAWKHDIKEMLGAMGINAIESIKGNRLRLRSIGLTEQENKILGVLPAGM